jgi:hypothetical protein
MSADPSARAPVIDLAFPHRWRAEILTARPAILPAHRFVYPLQAEEVERGAMEVLIRPGCAPGQDLTAHERQPPDRQEVSGHDFSRAETAAFKRIGASAPAETQSSTPSLRPNLEERMGVETSEPFLATCALGFRHPAVPTGLWSCPHPGEICAVSGGYAYLIDTSAPQRFTMVPFRPVLQVRPAPAENLLLFVGHYAVLAWGREGQAWQSEKLSDEGVTITRIENGILHGLGWNMLADRETPFALDLRTGSRSAPAERS